jgi:hypothetical protein
MNGKLYFGNPCDTCFRTNNKFYNYKYKECLFHSDTYHSAKADGLKESLDIIKSCMESSGDND